VLLELIQHTRDTALYIDAHARLPEAFVYVNRSDGNAVKPDVRRTVDLNHGRAAPGFAAGLGPRRQAAQKQKTQSTHV
jgi:hypothetical protein